MHASINPVNENLHVLMPVSPAQTLHLYLKEVKGNASVKIVFSRTQLLIVLSLMHYIVVARQR